MVKRLVEAALFIAGRELTREELSKMLKILPEQVERQVAQLEKEYEERDSCLMITNISGSYKMDINPKYLEQVRQLAPQVELGKGLMKALSYIAYKQPVRQSELVNMMGNRVYEYVHELKDRGFVKAERWGRSRRLETTDKFKVYFGTASLKKEGE